MNKQNTTCEFVLPCLPSNLSTPPSFLPAQSMPDIGDRQITTPHFLSPFQVLSFNVKFFTRSPCLTLMSDALPLPLFLLPFQVLSFNEKSFTRSPCLTLVTPDADPQGLEAPTVVPVTPTSLKISWNPPTKPNGRILDYKVRLFFTLQLLLLLLLLYC